MKEAELKTMEIVLSCKMCGFKPSLSQCNMDMSFQYQCCCGASSSRAMDEIKVREYWNKLMYCPNWNLHETIAERDNEQIRDSKANDSI